MRAVFRERYGPGLQVEHRQVPPPGIGPNEVLVRVRAAGVDRGVLHRVTGRPYVVRLGGYGLRRPSVSIPGRDLAGLVEQVGAAVTRLQPGQEVFGIGVGTYAEFARASVDEVAIKPERLTFTEAAALATSGVTALQGLRDQGSLRPGQRVLILGASGGVGTSAVQIAKAMGAEVTGVCRSGKVDLVRAMGADHVVDYSMERLDSAGRRYDLILDAGGNRPLSELRRMLTAGGVLVIVGGDTGGRWLGGADRQLRAVALSRFVGQDLKTFVSRVNYADLVALGLLVDTGQLRPVVDRTFALIRTGEALRYLGDGQARGKVVIAIVDHAARRIH